MMNLISSKTALPFQARLKDHAVYEAVTTMEQLRCFMEHHVYSVWDFMSLVKSAQSVVAPASAPWVPLGDAQVRRFMNELVLEEESDELPDEGGYLSHFELYLQAMEEIGADIKPVKSFVQVVSNQGVNAALALPGIPEPSRMFTSNTFEMIHSGKPHQVASALALGREHIIPCMFRAVLEKTGVAESEAPMFHYYLKRHIHLDGDIHGPMSLELLNQICAGDELRIQEAIGAAEASVQARLSLWDGILQALQALPQPRAQERV